MYCIVLLLASCQAKYVNDAYNPKPPVSNVPVQETGFTDYTIKKGEAYSVDSTKIELLNGISEMRFKFRFDSSAIYTTQDPSNQGDVNKLFGFADCINFSQQYTIPPHHIFSARFGWAWYNQALRIYAYYYNDSLRAFRELRTVEMGKSYTAGIRLIPGGYEYTIENKKDTVVRTCKQPLAVGYKLYPYFGGTETAPHEIHVYIKELF